MTAPSLEELRQNIGRYISTTRPREEPEVIAFEGQGDEGGSGWLVAVQPGGSLMEVNDVVSDHGEVPWIFVDYGMAWAILPTTTVTFTDVDFQGNPAPVDLPDIIESMVDTSDQ